LNEAASASPIAEATAAGGKPSNRYAPALKRLGRTDYARTWRAMQAFTDARAADTGDEFWLTEHAPVYTLGLAGRPEHILRANAIPVLKVDRGGQITYHGPGQLVVYLLIDLKRLRLGVRQLVEAIESAVIKLLDSYGIEAYGRRGAPGVYVKRDGREAKVAALGLKVRNGCTYHGFALNLDMDLAPFDDIDPCGYRGLAVTQLRDLDVRASRTEIEDRLVSLMAQAIATQAIVTEAIAGIDRKTR
jgi:lipoyl(octanoyl) transferase